MFRGLITFVLVSLNSLFVHVHNRRSFKPNGYFAVDVKNKEEGPEFWAIRG